MFCFPENQGKWLSISSLSCSKNFVDTSFLESKKVAFCHTFEICYIMNCSLQYCKILKSISHWWGQLISSWHYEKSINKHEDFLDRWFNGCQIFLWQFGSSKHFTHLIKLLQCWQSGESCKVAVPMDAVPRSVQTIQFDNRLQDTQMNGSGVKNQDCLKFGKVILSVL